MTNRGAIHCECSSWSLTVCLLVAASVPSMAADWTQWGGPNRDFRLEADAKPPAWPSSGLKELWTRDIGEGYSSMVMSGNMLFTMFRKGTQDMVIALDPGSGKTLWETSLDAPHDKRMNIEAGPGPHSTPAVAGSRIFVTTVNAHLVALDLKTGKRLWSQDLWKQHGGTFLERGYASSPLAYKDMVIVPVGGSGRALMAFRQNDGALAWKGGDPDNAYSSPIVIKAGGVDQVVSLMAKHVMGVDASNGKTLWTVEHKTMYDINAATPVWCPQANVVVVSSAYDGGARGIEVTSTAKELWHHRRLRVHHTNMVCKEGVVYGSSGDFGPAPMTAVDAKTGKVLWQDRAFAKAAFVLAGSTLFVVDDDGTVGMADISPQGMKVLGETQLLRANAWTAPMIAGSKLFVRDRHRLVALTSN